MQKVITKCTSCGTMLEVRNSKNEAVKEIKCPKCGCVLHVPFNVVPRINDIAKTQLGSFPTEKNTPHDSAETQLGFKPNPAKTNNSGETQLGPTTLPPIAQVQPRLKPGRLVCNGKEYPLKIGRNIVGRKSQLKPADIMLDVNDQYMSRQHIVIDVQQIGDTLRATIANYQNTNSTLVAGLPLNKGEEFVLSNGMEIKMGDTVIIYRSNK